MLRAIRICLRPKMNNGNNIIEPLESLGFVSGTNSTSGTIPSFNICGPFSVYKPGNRHLQLASEQCFRLLLLYRSKAP